MKLVKIKEFPVTKFRFECPICHRTAEEGVNIKKAVSSSFTDWAYVGRYICTDCSKLLSLYFYNYTVEAGEIRLFNVREIYDNLMRPHKAPFLFIITTSQKKHLFYRAVENESDDRFAVQFELETIFTTRDRMRLLFDFVELMQTLGAGKQQMLEGEIPFSIFQEPFGARAYEFLTHELTASREIQIPLYCGQKRGVTEEEAKCILDSILTTRTAPEPR